ncbi:MAG: hypothetical protein IBX63_10875 [Coriobacteriia bacterium]|nr:hypothetical protein [Coriobacteriia bacterium]
MSINALAAEVVTATRKGLLEDRKPDGVEALTKYIPTESITLYIATVSAWAALVSVMPWLTPVIAYTTFVVITPALMVVLWIRQRALDGQQVKVPLARWPWWRIVASTIAFAVWGLAVPGNPIIAADSQTGGVVAAFAALVISTLLNLVAPIFERRTP